MGRNGSPSFHAPQQETAAQAGNHHPGESGNGQQPAQHGQHVRLVIRSHVCKLHRCDPGILRIDGIEAGGLERKCRENLPGLLQQTRRNGIPKSQRQAISMAMSEGRRKTSPMCSTSNWVPRTGVLVRMSAIAPALTSRPG